MRTIKPKDEEDAAEGGSDSKKNRVKNCRNVSTLPPFLTTA